MLRWAEAIRWTGLVGAALAGGAGDWHAPLEGLGRGDHVCLARVRRLVSGQLVRMRAHESREG